MTRLSRRRWLDRIFNAGRQPRRPERPANRRRPQLEQLEDRVTPIVTSNVAGGILTINGTFSDTVFVSSVAGQVKVNGADPNSGAALSGSIIQINVNPGAGYNLVDLTNVLSADFTSLVNFNITSGIGLDTYKVNTQNPGTINSGNQANKLVFQGTATDVVANYVTDKMIFDGTTINIPGANTNVVVDVNMDTFTFSPGSNNHRILSDDPNPNDGISRAFNANDGSYTDFKNPASTLTIRDLTAGGNTYEYQSLDALDRPTSVVLDANNKVDTLVFGGSATNVVADYVNNKVSLDGQVVEIPNSDFTNVLFTTDMVNFTLNPGAGNHRVLRDNGVANDGISRAFNADDGSFTDFKNPSGSVTIKDINNTGGSTYEFEALDSVGTPPVVSLDTGTTNGDTQVINVGGTVDTVVVDLANNKVDVDGLVIGVPGAGFANLLLDMTMKNLVILPGAGNHRVLQDDGTANNGISRALNADDGSFTDFRNPTDSLTVLDMNATGGSTYEFKALDGVNQPASITLDSAGNANLEVISIPGVQASVVASLGAGVVTVGGLVINLPGTASSLLLDMAMTNLTLQPGAGNHRILEDDGVAGNGISRALNGDNGSYTDFRNPTGTLKVEDVNASGGSTYEFVGLDASGAPANIVLDSKNNANLEKISIPGAVGAVVVNLGAGTVSVAGRVITLPGVASSLFLDMNMTDLTIQPGTGNHRVLSDNGVVNDGVSRALNADDATYTDFRNPTGTLKIENITGAGGSTYEFQGLDPVKRPASIVFDSKTNADLHEFSGKATNVVEDLVNDKVIIDGVEVGILGDNADVFIDTNMVNFFLILQLNNHRILRDDPTPFNGISRAFNASNNSFSDFRNPTGTLTVQGTGPNAIIENEGLDAVGRPERVVILGASNPQPQPPSPQPLLVPVVQTNVAQGLAVRTAFNNLQAKLDRAESLLDAGNASQARRLRKRALLTYHRILQALGL